jgi:hypothetical protein
MSNATETLSLPAGHVLTVVTGSAWVGNVQRLGDSAGDAVQSTATLTAGTTYTYGPFTGASWWKINQTSGSYTHSSALDFGSTSTNVGTPSTGVTAREYGDGHNHVTVLTVDTTLPAIAGGAALGVGKLLYTMPAGAVAIHAAKIDMAITQTEGNITADTPEVGLGSVIASGVVSVLSGTATFEDILTGQVAADCDGEATVKTVANQPMVMETGAAHTVHFNVADTWAASGDAAALLAGTVTLHWTFLG